MLDIVIVNWNAGGLLRSAVDSIGLNHRGLVDKVIVVDNGSTDVSISLLQDATHTYAFSVEIVKNNFNRGFGAACNQGANLGQSPFVLFLNPDAEVFENSLEGSLAYLQKPENSRVGICGVQLIDESGAIARSCSRFPSLRAFVADLFGLSRIPLFCRLGNSMAEWDHGQTREVDQVIGAFFLMRRNVFEKMGGFDERFFVYFEEVDLSLRSKKAGWKTVYLGDVQAFHSGGGTSSQVKATRLFYSLRSRLFYGFKHFSRTQAWALLLVTLLLEPIARSIFFLAKGRSADVRQTIKGYSALLAAMPVIMREIRQ